MDAIAYIFKSLLVRINYHTNSPNTSKNVVHNHLMKNRSSNENACLMVAGVIASLEGLVEISRDKILRRINGSTYDHFNLILVK